MSWWVILLAAIEGAVTALAGVRVQNGWADTLVVLILAWLIFAAYAGGKAGW